MKNNQYINETDFNKYLAIQMTNGLSVESIIHSYIPYIFALWIDSRLTTEEYLNKTHEVRNYMLSLNNQNAEIGDGCLYG